VCDLDQIVAADPELASVLRARACARTHEAEGPTVAVHRVRPKRDGCFHYDPEGRWAVVLPIEDRDREIADIVAWLPEQPERWRYRRGGQIAVLGARNLAVALWRGEPVRLWSTPRDWLIAGGNGAVVLDFGADLRELFDGIPQVIAPAEAIGPLTAALRRREPRLTVAQDGVRDAA